MPNPEDNEDSDSSPIMLDHKNVNMNKRKRPPPQSTTAAKTAKQTTTVGKKQGGAGGGVKRVPKAQQKKTAYEKDNSDTDADLVDLGEVSEEDESIGGADQMSKILSKIGSELQQRIKIKKQRLEMCFQSVKGTPNEILETLRLQTDERRKIVDSFQVQTKEVLEQVEAVVQLQNLTEDKLSKMMMATQKSFDQIKDALRLSIKGLNEAVTKFANETGELEGKHEDESKKQIKKIHQELGILQKKILADGRDEEVQNINSALGTVK